MTDSIQITFDKSHLVTIGEKLYGESLELLRELISNAYDADATEVYIEVTPDSLTVRDNGSGMDEQGLREFFIIGSQNKKYENVSPRFKRERIGQFGIGKFAVLTACESFRVQTQRGDFAGEVTFDKRHWNEGDSWNVPLQRVPVSQDKRSGTTVILENLKSTFSLPDIERYVRERMPLNTPHFAVFLNGKKIESRVVIGRKFPINTSTPYGTIRGELTLPRMRQKFEGGCGIECVVRGVVICRSVFGIEDQIVQKLCGQVEANFVPITSDRTRFITDTQEYRTFVAAMTKELRNIIRLTKEHAKEREQQKADQTLKDTLTRMRKAIKRNPDIAPPVMSVTGEMNEGGRENVTDSMSPEADFSDSNDAIEAFQVNVSERDHADSIDETEKIPEVPKKIRVKNLRGKTVVARSIKIGGIGITCTLENCGRGQPAAFTEAGIVYINIDHPLYRRQQLKGQDLLGFYLTYLLSQQVSLMMSEGDIRRAFEIQDRLLTDSW